MPRKARGPVGHTGQTAGGHIRDVKVDRVGPVTIYKRGETYYLYYRENRKSERRRVDGNLQVARATAAKVAAALGENRPSPLGFERTAPTVLTKGYLDFVTNVQKLAWRTQDRYRAALDRFGEFCAAAEITAVDSVDERSVEDFVRWLRGQTRTRNGAKKGKRDVYAVGGVKFILSTCRTAFNWAARRRMLPPYAENPFSRFPIDNLRDVDAPDEGLPIFTPEQQKAFFTTCNDWQRGIFQALVTYGMRVGELTNLLIENVDFHAGSIQICSKPELHWRVKTARRRQLPITREMRTILEQRIGERRAGFVFLNEEYFNGRRRLISEFGSDRAFREKLAKLAHDLTAKEPNTTDKQRRQLVTAYCRRMGQIPVKRVQLEFCKLTTEIGCPQFTRAHNLRHLFSSRAQEEGVNPLLVQEILGHATLTMTKRYTHLGMDAKREALERLVSD
ncbi:MAG: hypothetical protein FJ302_11345 [Planctomycetes bacterium]|nr:hypothetical protein [Planctomycetota bacterium]